MMESSQNLLELVAMAQASAKTFEDSILEISNLKNAGDESDPLDEELRAATASLEAAAVDIFSVFEVRLQHHFRRGPFSRKLKSRLLAVGQTDLADRVYQYYLATNVLKHGKGASYRELLKAPSTLFVLKPSEDIIVDETRATSGLVDVSVPGFFEGLTSTILEAYHFLENK